MSYTSAEQNAAVSGLVKGSLSFSKDRLGPRDVNSSFSEAQELVNTTLLYEPDAIFYLVFLASNRLQRLITDEIDTIDELLDAIDDLLKPDKPIDDLTGLSSAEAALLAMESAMSRSGGVGAQEYSRYLSSMDRFTKELAKTTRYTYVPRGSNQTVTDVVRPQSQAKQDVRTNLDLLTEKHASTLTAVDRILTAFSDFQALDLPAACAAHQVSRARQQVTDLKEKLAALLPSERTPEAREALLEALANRGVVRAVAQSPAPGARKVYQKLGAAPRYRLTASGEGTAPVLVGTVSAPFKLSSLAGSEAYNLRLAMNGGSGVTFNLLPSGLSYQVGVQQARVEGGIAGPFVIRAEQDEPWDLYTEDTGSNYATTTGVDDLLHIVVDGVRYEVTLPANATPNDVRDAVNGEAGLQDVVTASTVAGESSGNRVRIVYDYTTPANRPSSYSSRFMQIVNGAQPAVLGPWKTDDGTVSTGSSPTVTGWDGNDRLWVKANDDDSHQEVSLPTGSYPDYEVATSAVVSSITSAGGSEFSGVGTTTVAVVSALAGEGSIITLLSEGTIPSGDRAGQFTRSLAGLATLGFFEHQEDRQRDIDGRVVANLLNGDSQFSSEALARLERVDYVQVRNATKLAVGSDPGHVKMQAGVENDPTAGLTVEQLKLEVSNGDNRGIYELQDVSWLAGILTVEVKNRSFRDTDTTLLHTLTIYGERLAITSKDASTTGSLEVLVPSQDARAVLGLPTGEVKSTVGEVFVEFNDPNVGWKGSDLKSVGVKVEDDIIQESTGDRVTEVTSIANARSGYLSVSPEVAPDLSLDTTQGFYILSAAAQLHDDFIGELSSWRSTLSPFEDLTTIDRLISPLLNVKGSDSRVNQAYTAVEGLRDKMSGAGSLLELVQSFTITRIDDVEDALNSLRERGYDRAAELLLTGQPASFPGMVSEQASFGRAAMSAMSEVAVEDINEPKTINDNEFLDVYQQLTQEIYEDKDPLHDFSDMEDEPEDPMALELWEGLE